MDTGTLLGVLAFGTMGAGAVFAYLGSVRTFERMEQHGKKSTLASDAPSTLPAGEKPADT